MNKFIKITKAILNLIFTIIIIVGVVFIALYCFGVQPYVVETGSMRPTMDVNSLCFINKRANYDDMREGDIIAFKLESGAFATHRIKTITEEGFETKGDANSAPDRITITKENFIGKNIFSIPKIGVVVKSMQTLSGKIVLGTIVLVLFLAGILIGEPSKKRKGKSKNVKNSTCE